MAEVKKIKKDKFILKNLYYQYIPGLVNMDIWNNDMSLPNSPQVELAEILLQHGRDWGKIKNCRFVADRRHRYEKGLTKWTISYIKKHIFESRYGILKSIKKHGYKEKLCKSQPMIVLKKPLLYTRWDNYPEISGVSGPEIVTGGRRSAAAYVLGYEKLPGYWVEDVKPKTNQYKGFK